MKIKHSLTVLPILFFLISCASTQPNPLLNDAKMQYEKALMIDGIKNSDPQSMDNAKEALDKATKLHEGNESKSKVDHYALVSIKNTEIAGTRHRLKQIEHATERAQEKRQQLILENKTSALKEARIEANNAKLEAIKLASQLDDLKAEQTERGIIMTMQNILFAFNSAELQPVGETVVSRIANYLNDYPNRNILIEGFTDNIGSEEYNLKLSRERGDSVKRSLIRYGVSPHRISIVGLGEAFPVASNSTEAGRQQNRRVEIVISNEDGKPILNR